MKLENAGRKFRNLKSKIDSSKTAVIITMKESKYINGLLFTCLSGLLYLTMIQTQWMILEQWTLLSHFFSHGGMIWWYLQPFKMKFSTKHISHHLNAFPPQLLWYLLWYSWFRLNLTLSSLILEGEAEYFSFVYKLTYICPF